MLCFTDMPFGQASSGLSNPTKVASHTSKRFSVVNPTHKRSETELAGAINPKHYYLEEVVNELIDTYKS